MRVSPSSLSDAATRLEQDRERDFFRLLYIVDRARLLLSVPVTNVDWRLTCDCLDEINYRYADYAFLLGFSATYVLRNRAGRTFLSRFRLPLYAGLVANDLELRAATPAPALQYWNSISTVDSEVGRIARVLHTPDCFYEVATGRQESKNTSDVSDPSPPLLFTWGDPARTSFFVEAFRGMRYVAQSLPLPTLCSHVFAGSSWRHRVDEHTEVTALVLNNRFLSWRVFESSKVRQNERMNYNINLHWFPTVAASEGIRRSFQCRDLILERSTLGGKLWYRTHFTLLRLLGLEAL